MRLKRMFSLPALAAAFVLSAAFVRPATATPIEFIFAGTVTYYDAYYQTWPDPVVEHFPPLAVPGDLFTGTAWYEPELSEYGNPTGGFEVRANGTTWGGSYAGACCGEATLTETDLVIVADFDRCGGGYTSWGDARFQVSLASGTGYVGYANDFTEDARETMGGMVTSFHAVPDPGSTLLLFGIGLVGLKAFRKRWQ